MANNIINKPNLSEYFYRAVGTNESELNSMLSKLGVSSSDELIEQTIPKSLPRSKSQNIPPLTAEEAINKLHLAVKKNTSLVSMLGMGFYDTIMPAPIRRHILENAGWYTAYTPYQPEISQGRLEALLNFQYIVTKLTGLDIANASLLDEASATAEAMLMSLRNSKKNKSTLLLDENCHPATRSVLETRAEAIGINIVSLPIDKMVDYDNYPDVFATVLSYPDTWGRIHNLQPIINKIQQKDAMVILNCDLMSLLKLKSPAELNADIAIGSSQSFGLPMGAGGPHAAFIACKAKYLRSLPGRLVGISHDRLGKPALRLAMQTREQHIRRDRATSNICTAQSLPAILASMYAVYHGYSGLSKIFCRIHGYAKGFAKLLKEQNITLLSEDFFQTVSFKVAIENNNEDSWYRLAYKAGFEIRQQHSKTESLYSLSFDETFDDQKWELLISGFSAKLKSNDIKKYTAPKPESIRSSFARKDTPLQHSTFKKYTTETAFLRYTRRLMDKDLALDRSMIPLGSCTMKINPAIAMETLSIKGLSDMHPYTDKSHITGLVEIINDLCDDLKNLTGFDHVSIQPNAGSQGEVSGLIAIKKYFESIGQSNRNICIIPQSAHGTNPASATGVGYNVIVIPSTPEGNIDENKLSQLIETHGENIALFMMTYPSTHGVFEDSVLDVIKQIKGTGAQVYIDGANLNAMLGLVRIGDLGADVCHMNLHKTFAIPHGGGGPGIGPIGIKSHLIPFAPGNPLVTDDGAICASEYGSASILSISWMYIKLLGYYGLQQSSIRAIVHANYIASSLKDYFPTVFSGTNGRLAHECILDCRQFQSEAGVSVEDIAKRLVDYGIHAPTIAWPVMETLMVEPTESETKDSLDYFIACMQSIYKEISKIKSGKWPRTDNPLVNAPHVLSDLLADEWNHAYSRKVAFAETEITGGFTKSGYLASCSRIDQIYGDKNPVFTYPE